MDALPLPEGSGCSDPNYITTVDTHIIGKHISSWADCYYVCVLVKNMQRDWTVVFACNKTYISQTK